MGITRWLDTSFRNHPLLFPAGLIGLGGIAFVVPLTLGHGQGIRFAIYGLLALILGAGLLPFGVIMSVRRRRNLVVLTCPRCHVQSRMCEKPFQVQRWANLDYAYVVCSQCGADFTVDKYANLR